MSHTTEIRVRFYELDPYNHVNHTNYLAYFEAARVEYLGELGFGLDVMAEQGVQIVVVEMHVRFLAAARLGDVLTVTTTVAEVGRVTSTWHQEIIKGDERVCSMEIKAAFTDLEGRPRRAPEDFVAAVGS